MIYEPLFGFSSEAYAGNRLSFRNFYSSTIQDAIETAIAYYKCWDCDVERLTLTPKENITEDTYQLGG
jgi:hypothetical protein